MPAGKSYSTQSTAGGTDRDDTYVGDFLLKRDIDEASKRFTGREMFLATNLSGLRRGEMVRVGSIVPGSNWRDPIRIEFEGVSGQKGYVDVALSATNTSRPFPNLIGEAALRPYFSPNPPKSERPLTRHDLDAISRERVYIGMSERAARESWGWPDSVNRTTMAGHVHEQWVYGLNSYLYFDDGRLTAIQN